MKTIPQMIAERQFARLVARLETSLSVIAILMLFAMGGVVALKALPNVASLLLSIEEGRRW